MITPCKYLKNPPPSSVVVATIRTYYNINNTINYLFFLSSSFFTLQVAPSELEEVILQHPKVKEVGVIGVPHDRFGEAPRAFIVASSPATEKEIQE